MSFVGSTPPVTPLCVYAMPTHFPPLYSGHLSLARMHALAFILPLSLNFLPVDLNPFFCFLSQIYCLSHKHKEGAADQCCPGV